MTGPATGATILYYARQDGWRPEGEILFQDERASQRDKHEASAKPSPRKLRLLRPSDLDRIAAPTSLVKALLFQGQFSTIFGAPNVGKTFFALDLALHVATGRKWRERRCKRGFVVYVALEGLQGIRNRFDAWCKHHAVSRESVPIAFGDGTLSLRDDQETRQSLISDAIAEAKRRELPLSMIVIDTLARAMNGGDENASPEMGKLIAGADEIRLMTAAHVCLIHHVGKDASRGARGHSSLHGAADTMIEIVSDKGRIEAKVTKQKEAEREGRFPFKLQSVALDRNDEDGDPMTSAVAIIEAAPIEFPNENLNERQRAGAMILRRLVQENFGDEVSEGDNGKGVPIAVSAWKAVLENAGWPSNEERGEEARRTKIGQGVEGRDTDCGQKPDNSRTRGNFVKAFSRLREDLVKQGIISIEGENVFLAKG